MVEIDLTRHAVVEASAGTGKTYTIEQLVARLLTETDAELAQLLIVTYTEKATGELRTRLRAKLERTPEQPEHEQALRAALDQFDQAPIFTIHGFCQRLLQEHAMEQGQDFQVALVDDVEVMRLLLREVQRKDWPAKFGPHLREVLENAAYRRGKADEWDRAVLQLAKDYNPRCGHRLRPEPADGWWLRPDDPTSSRGQLEVFTIDCLHRRLADYKRQRGLQSFDDMIARVDEALDPARSPGAEDFARLVRGRYRCGIVDEFQDTDPLQWRIFRRLFLEGEGCRLFVVGDPKQAIFGFRNADLPTYHAAKAQMKEEFAAKEYPQEVNWRSCHDLLEGLNCVFSDGEWFPPETKIQYVHVRPPDADQQQTVIVTDLTNRAALTVVDLEKCQRLKLAHKQFARFLAMEIHGLLRGRHGQPALTYTHRKGPAKPLTAGDFCVLIFKRTEAEAITEALRQFGIPYTFHKQTGLWDTEEAVQLETLLRTLARPEEGSSFRKALLTCFFRVRPQDLAQAPDLPDRHPARLLYQRWLACAEGRHWAALFQSLLEETGLLFASAGDPEAERRAATFRHLFGTLERVGHGENRDLLGLLDWIKQRRASRESDGDVQPAEAGGSRVRIMTVHASKGLEFPVVFLAGGFTQGRGGGLTKYRDEGQRRVFDLCPEGEAAERMRAEELSEQRRLLYVALTRAMFKLYVPMVKVTNRGAQYAGPVGTVLLPALTRACPERLGPLVAEVVPPPLALSPPRLAEAPAEDAPPAPAPLTFAGQLFPTFDGSLARRRTVVRSFSSMSRTHVATVGQGASYGERLPRLDEEALGPAERDDPLRGPAFGQMAHAVLEAVDFAEVGRAASPDALLADGAPARRVIEAAVRSDVGKLRSRAPARALEQACAQQIARLVWNALHTPLSHAGGPLWQLADADRLHEVEFHYPERPGETLPAGVRWEDGFLTGYIDLVFRRAGRYYLLDWKTNLLAGYGPDAVHRCMDELDYHRQYRLYAHALDRWLTRVHGDAFDFDRDFGGVYYLFLRGLDGRDDSAGVFFHRPTRAELDLDRVLGRTVPI